METTDYQLDKALIALQSKFSNFDERIEALRFLMWYLATNEQLDTYNRKRINQLVLDNSLQIMLENDSINPFRKQLIRVELFSILSNLLRSESLFGSQMTEGMKQTIERLTSRSTAISESSNDLDRSRLLINEEENTEGNQLNSVAKVGRISSKGSGRKPWKPVANAFSAVTALQSAEDSLISKSPDKNNATRRSNSIDLRRSSMMNTPLWRKHIKRALVALDTDGENSDHANNDSLASSHESPSRLMHSSSLILQVLSKKPPVRRVEMSAKLNPRPAVLFNDKLVKDNFAPGIDPFNFIEQDKKLGYQKPRMWFPTPMINISKDTVEKISSIKEPNQVVEQYLRMKALASYVGDSILPHSNDMFSSIKTRLLQDVSVLPNQTSTADSAKYSNALREVMDMWSPILDAHKPEFGKKRIFSYIKPSPPPQLPIREIEFYENYMDYNEFSVNKKKFSEMNRYVASLSYILL